MGEWFIALKIFFGKFLTIFFEKFLVGFTALCGAALTWLGVYKKIIVPYQMRRKESIKLLQAANDNMLNYFAKIDNMASDLSTVKKEVLQDGGYSLKDIAIKTSDDLKTLRYRFKAMMQFADKPSFWCDRNGYCTMANKKLIDLYGADSESQMLGLGWLSYVEDSDKDRALKDWNEAIRNNQESENYFHVMNRKTGRIFEIKYNAIFFRENDEIITICGVVSLP